VPGATRIVSLIGNPRPQSRTHALARTLSRELTRVAADASTVEIDLAVLGPNVLDATDPDVASAVEDIAAADVLVLASPTYSATYSGLLKAFLDRLPHLGLVGKTAVPVLLGGAPNHQLAVNVHFAPLLLELGATVPAGGLFVLESDVDEFAGLAARWADLHGPALVGEPRTAAA
jgi:FMN reductase